jgi:hypothetical protein
MTAKKTAKEPLSREAKKKGKKFIDNFNGI